MRLLHSEGAGAIQWRRCGDKSPLLMRKNADIHSPVDWRITRIGSDQAVRIPSSRPGGAIPDDSGDGGRLIT